MSGERILTHVAHRQPDEPGGPLDDPLDDRVAGLNRFGQSAAADVRQVGAGRGQQMRRLAAKRRGRRRRRKLPAGWPRFPGSLMRPQPQGTPLGLIWIVPDFKARNRSCRGEFALHRRKPPPMPVPGKTPTGSARRRPPRSDIRHKRPHRRRSNGGEAIEVLLENPAERDVLPAEVGPRRESRLLPD